MMFSCHFKHIISNQFHVKAILTISSLLDQSKIWKSGYSGKPTIQNSKSFYNLQLYFGKQLKSTKQMKEPTMNTNLFLCKYDTTQQLVLQSFNSDSEVNDGSPCTHLCRKAYFQLYTTQTLQILGTSCPSYRFINMETQFI